MTNYHNVQKKLVYTYFFCIHELYFFESYLNLNQFLNFVY